MHAAQGGTQGDTEEERRMYTDRFIAEKWGALIESDTAAIEWATESSPLGALAAIILYDQLPRQAFRGTSKAFAFDSRACAIGNRLLTERSSLFASATNTPDVKDVLPWTYQIFVFFALLHSENVADCERGACGLANLYEILKARPEFKTQAGRMLPLLRSAKEHLQTLAKFGRYPHRNAVLCRVSTDEERAFLQYGAKPSWMLSQEPRAVKPRRPVGSSGIRDRRKDAGFRVLVLHSNRQVPLMFQKRTREAFAEAVGEGSTLVYACAPHKYVARGEALNNTKHVHASNQTATRCWWNASDDPSTMIYTGMEETIRYIDELAANSGPFDGIIGFSQGGTLAGLLAALVSDKSPSVKHLAATLQFVVIISGFFVRDTRPEFVRLNGPLRDKANPIQVPSFHVWGLNDTLVLPERSAALRDSFADVVNGVARVTETHQLDHYKKAISAWPVGSVKQWLHANFKPRSLNSKTDASLQDKLFAVRDKRYVAPLEQASVDDELAAIMQNVSVTERDVVLGASVILTERAQFNPKKPVVAATARALIELAKKHERDNVDWTAKVKTLLAIFPNAALSFYSADKSVKAFRQGIVDVTHDAIVASLERKQCTFIAAHLPKGKNKRDGLLEAIVSPFKQFHVVYGAGPFEGKLDVVGSYQKLISALDKYADKADHSGDETRASRIKKGARTPEDLERMLAAPLSDAILNPKPEPVDVAPEKEMKHLHDFLRSIDGGGGDSSKDELEMIFPRGTLCPDGRLDLCKQVIGPHGVNDLHLSLQIDGSSATPRVRHLLLGNNIAGSGLAEAVAKLIKNKATAITTWYIAGNELDAQSIVPVTDAMESDDFVQQLWLKRNPLRSAGANPIGKMLSVNTFLKVLDLTNTGILDEGAHIICKALAANRRSALSVLYLNSNGLTIASMPSICEMLRCCKLTDLGLGANRIGDKGVTMLAECIQFLQILEVSSCGIGYIGVEAIASQLASNSTLKKLDLGFLKSTNALGEVPNAMGNRGASALAAALRENTALLSLNLLHNGIYQQGVSDLANALAVNKTLLYLNVEQLGIPHNELTRESIRTALKRNMAALSEEQKSEALAIINRDHLSEVKSVYRIEGNDQ